MPYEDWASQNLEFRTPGCFAWPYATFLFHSAAQAYSNGAHFWIKVIEPAVLEVNGLSDIGVQIELVRRHPRAPVTAVTLAWWKKQGDEFRSAVQERGRSKMGRMARLRGTVEVVAPLNLPPLV